MKRPGDPTIHAIASLGGADWNRYIKWLEDSLADARDQLEASDNPQEIHRLQGEVRSLKEQLKMIEDAPAIVAGKRR